jgi:signal transduction histidine kinase
MNATVRLGWPFIRRAALAAGLAVLAVAGNVVHLPLFFGVDLIFGSVAALVALIWLGPAAGLVAAVAGGLYTLQMWGHPYALLILTLEMAVVALLVRRGWYLVIATAAYWVVIGGPLALALYSGPLGMDWTAASLIAIKQPVNGILNATLASFALLAIQALTPFGPLAPVGALHLRHLLFSLFMALTLLPGMALMGVEGWHKRLDLERALAKRMDLAATALARQPGPAPTPVQGVVVTFLDEQGQPLGAGTAPSTARGRPAVADGLRVRLSGNQTLPSMMRWKRGDYLRTVTVTEPGPAARARVRAPAEPLVRQLRAGQLRQLALLAALAVAAAGAAALLSRRLTQPLEQLNRLTHHLPERIRTDQSLPRFPATRIVEFHTFIRTLRHMSEALAQSLRSSEAARTDLETRVRARTADLERRNAELRRLAEVAAHHLQEPVRRSMAFVQRLQRQMPEESKDAQRLQEQLAAMSTLIGDLQAYLAYQTRPPHPEPTALGAALERACGDLGAETNFRLSTDPDPLPTVAADPALLDTLLHQLLANAVRYRQPDQPLEVHVTARYRSGSWEIAVTDNGQGMEAAYLERVFRLFERLYPNRDPEGTGLGLALARLIIENHGGWIRAESNGPGRGTTIRFTLPDPHQGEGSAETTDNPEAP